MTDLTTKTFNYDPSIRTVFGANSLEQLGDLARQLAGPRVLLVTDPGIVQAGIAAKAQTILEQAALEPFTFSEVAENPTTAHVEQGVHCARQHAPIDLIIGLGGGSAMDCAKGINFILTNGGKMEDYWGKNKAPQPMLPSIGVPTTAGTGSEAQSFALIAQAETHEKMACGDRKARFHTVILDPALTTSAPPTVTVATGLDAIAHAIESYVSTAHNPISQLFAREAWRLLAPTFTTVLAHPADLEARGHMLLGAHLAGMAIENSMLGAAHACANPLTARYSISHGVAVGLFLPHVIRYNNHTVGPLYNELCDTAQLTHADLAASIDQFKASAGLPQRLRDLQVETSDLPQMAHQATDQWTGTFNPRPLTEADFLYLYEAAY